MIDLFNRLNPMMQYRQGARKLSHADDQRALERPFVLYVGNVPGEVRKHFHGVREAVPHLRGLAIFDRLDQELPSDLGAEGMMWQRKEIENYLCYTETLEDYARGTGSQEAPGLLFSTVESKGRVHAMGEAIKEVIEALETLGKGSPWDDNTKVSDEFLTPVFEKFFKKLRLPNVMAKKNFHELAEYVLSKKIDPEVREKLDAIVRVAKSAIPAGETS